MRKGWQHGLGLDVISNHLYHRLSAAPVWLVSVATFGAAVLVAWLLYQTSNSGRLPESFPATYLVVILLLAFGCVCSGAAFWTAVQRRMRRQYQSYLSSCLRSILIPVPPPRMLLQDRELLSLFEATRSHSEKSLDLKSLIAICHEAVFVLDEALVIHMVNSAAESLTRCERNLLVGNSFLLLLAEEDKLLLAEMEKVRRQSNASWRREFDCHFLLRSGRKIPALLTISWYGAGFIALATDTTARQTANQMRAEFGRVIGSGLQGCLGEVEDFVDLLGCSRSGSAEARNRLSRVTERILFAESIVSGLISDECAMVDVGPIDLASLVLSVSRSMALLAGLVIVAIENEKDLAPTTVRADRNQIERVLQNLIGNAIKVSAPGSTVAVAVSAKDGVCRVEVVDEGPGVAEAEIAEIFRPFRQGVNKSGGFGLGLSICRDIIHKHEGRLGAFNRTSGCCFWFEIPLAEELVEAPDGS